LKKNTRTHGGRSFPDVHQAIGGNDPAWFHAGKNLDLKVLMPTRMPIDTGEMEVVLDYLDRTSMGDKKIVFNNGELILDKKLGAGVDGAVFLGSIGSLGDKVAIKTITHNIAVWSGGRWVVNEYWLWDWLREYELMSRLDCPEYPPGKRSPGAIVCAIGAVAVILRPNKLYGFIILERMDSDLHGFCTRELPKIPQPIRAKVGFHILLQTISKMNRLHRLGVYHGDAHNGNWMVKYVGVSGYPDVRIGDMGRSCIIKNQKNDTYHLGCDGYDHLTNRGGVYTTLFLGDRRRGWSHSKRDLAEYAMFAKTLYFMLFNVLNLRQGVDISTPLYMADAKIMEWAKTDDPWVIEQSGRTYREFMYEDRLVYGSRTNKTRSMWAQILDCIRKYRVFTPHEWYDICMEGLATPGVRCVRL
jgi:hypothetical protein